MSGGHHIFWGETHDNTYQYDVLTDPIDRVIGRAASHLDFYAAAYYTGCSPAFRTGGHAMASDAPQALILEEWKDTARLDREWAEVQEATRALNDPGAFVTFPGYEWQGSGISGDHNVFALVEGLPIFRVDTVAKLYAQLRGRQAIAIPHHVGYRPGVRGRDWSVFDGELSPFAEIFSVHGCSETDEEWIGLRRNTHMGPGIGAGVYQAALDRGLRVGCICSTDNWGDMPGHYGHGRMACLAAELTRPALWAAFKARHVYGVTGDRIELDFRVDNGIMGDIIEASGARHIRVRVRGSDAIDRIELLRGSRVIATHCHQGAWSMPPPGRRTRFKMRLEAGWGPRANEMPGHEQDWKGCVRLGDGRFRGCEVCWISPQPGTPVLAGDAAHLHLRSSAATVEPGPQNAVVLEFEAASESPIHCRLNGVTASGTVAELAAASRELWYRDDCVRMLHDRFGLAPDSPEREDIYHHMAFKAKLHRPIPEAGYTARLELDDDEPLRGETHYRVRVEQRNGQRAWSSPIWVRPRPQTSSGISMPSAQ